MKSYRNERLTSDDDRSVDPAPSSGTAFGYPRDFFKNRFVYTVVSPRARGLSVGVNMNPDKHCDFDCVYCEVNRQETSSDLRLDVPTMAADLEFDWLRANPEPAALPEYSAGTVGVVARHVEW